MLVNGLREPSQVGRERAPDRRSSMVMNIGKEVAALKRMTVACCPQTRPSLFSVDCCHILDEIDENDGVQN